ncbi:hypothetical protein GRI39_13865 [Altererythrobacter indicus]|uniref:Uncharacterized protein n=1 Tax=Altericroceibacterium indicum TaxID=374177 RepID=A0A845AEY4_9SPHN|nr:hypothetical protein [Altericroceibacterium indicum]MXP27116.1 hypothetical protein [Altericroceibacterium indicum]
MKATWIIGLAILATGISACSGTEEDAKKSVAVSDTSEEAAPATDMTDAVPADGTMAATPADTTADTSTPTDEPTPAST